MEWKLTRTRHKILISAQATTLAIDDPYASIALHATDIALGRRASTRPHEPIVRTSLAPDAGPATTVTDEVRDLMDSHLTGLVRKLELQQNKSRCAM